jgi:hypothetical protein
VAGSLGWPDGDLRYAERGESGWTFQDADTAGSVGFEASLVLDAAGEPHVSYYDRTAQTIDHAFRTAGAWRVETVASVGDGAFSSLALDHAGNPFVAYYDQVARDLRFARRAGGGWSS